MVDEKPQMEAEPVARKRDRSQIEFPYSDLERAVELSHTLHREGEQAKIEIRQLAVALDQSADGGTFRGRLSAAKMFGLIDYEQGMVGLSPLGLKIIDDAEAAASRAEAFLNVPLYREMFDRYKGYALPPAAALERQIKSLGVPPKQKERARQAFMASLTYAGYLAANGRFSRPIIAAARAAPLDDEASDRDEGDEGGGSGSGGGSGGGGRVGPEIAKLHPFIQGLLKTLPEADQWPVGERVKWLQTAASIFGLIYKEKDGTSGGEIAVTIKSKENGGQ